MNNFKKYLGLIFLVSLVAPVAVVYWRRPPRTEYTAELFQGIRYTRQPRTTPRPLMVHIVEIDLQNPNIRLLVTPGDKRKGLELPARTTSIFAEEFGVQIAINGSFFGPFRVGNFIWDYYPHNGDPVDIKGLAVSNGEVYSEIDKPKPVLCIKEKSAIIRHFDCPVGTLQALAGNPMLVEGGQVVIDGEGTLHPRTAVAVDATGEVLWLIVVDGRQRGYSEGVTLVELAELALEVGASSVINLDGGGSSTLVTLKDGQVQTLNSPIHKRIPMWNRPVANHLGVYTQQGHKFNILNRVQICKRKGDVRN